MTGVVRFTYDEKEFLNVSSRRDYVGMETERVVSSLSTFRVLWIFLISSYFS